MKITLLGALGAAAGALAAGPVSRAAAQTLLCSFGPLYNEQGEPDPAGTRPDGFHSNPPLSGTFVAPDTFGATLGARSLKFVQNFGETFTGEITELGAPFDVIDNPATPAVAVAYTVRAGEEYAGGFANLGITVFGDNKTLGEGQAQTVVASEQPVKLAPGTYRLVIPLIARFNPYTFDLDVPFHTILGNNPTSQMTGTSFQFYVNKRGAAGNGTFTGYFDNVRALSNPVGAWNFDADGNWGEPSNWLGLPSPVPDGVDHIALFGLSILAPRTVTVDAPRTVGTLYFNNGSGYTLAGTNPITLDVSSGEARIDSHVGSHTVTAPLVLNDDVLITVGTGAGAPSASVLTLGGPITATGRTITKAGAARLDVGSLSAAGLTVNSGTVLLRAGSGTSRVQVLTIPTVTTPRRLDITNNALVIDYASGGPSPIADVRAHIGRGFAGGGWNGSGIVTSHGDATTLGGGYAEASALSPVPAGFGSGDARAVLLRLTRYGDANLDGLVNLADFNRLASNFGSTSAVWSQGDFNYDGNVNLADFNRLASNFGQSAAGPGVTPDDWAALASAIPEPTSALSLRGIATIALKRRDRRRQRPSRAAFAIKPPVMTGG